MQSHKGKEKFTQGNRTYTSTRQAADGTKIYTLSATPGTIINNTGAGSYDDSVLAQRVTTLEAAGGGSNNTLLSRVTALEQAGAGTGGGSGGGGRYQMVLVNPGGIVEGSAGFGSKRYKPTSPTYALIDTETGGTTEFGGKAYTDSSSVFSGFTDLAPAQEWLDENTSTAIKEVGSFLKTAQGAIDDAGGASSGVQAKCSFNGAGTVDAGGKVNVSSVTRTGQGLYTVAFASAVTNPIVQATIADGINIHGYLDPRESKVVVSNLTTTGCVIKTGKVNYSDVTYRDADCPVHLIVF